MQQRHNRLRSLRFAVALGVAAALSCAAPVVNESDGVDHVVLTPTSATLEVGGAASFSAIVVNAAGKAMRDRRVVWTSENEAVATVSASGAVIALSAGSTQIAASSGGKSASASVTVTGRPVALVRITPGTARLAVNSTLQLRAEALDAAGDLVTGAVPVWASSDGSVASIGSDGLVTGVSPGSVTITATVAGRVGSAAIAVSPQPVASVVLTQSRDTIFVGGRAAFGAVALDAEGAVLADRIVFWSSDNAAVAAVSSDGEVFALSVGRARIRATIEGLFAEAEVAVLGVPVARVAVTPNELTLTPGQTSQLTVTLSDSAGNRLLDRPVTFTAADARIATVSSDGLVIAIAEGTTQIEVACEGVVAAVALTVNPPPVASVELTPNVASLRVGQNVQLQAQPRDARGVALMGRSVTWTSAAPAIASVNQSGLVSAVGPGVALITATSEGRQASATVTVSLVPAAVISVAPKPVALQAAQSQQLTVQLADSSGNPLSPAGRALFWTSRNSAVASVSLSGLVTAVAPGNAYIVVTTANALDSVDVSVTAAPSVTLSVRPANYSLLQGEVRGLRAVVTSNGNPPGTSSVTWQSRAPAVVAVSAVAGSPDSAAVTAISLGTAYVIATESSGARDSALVVVSATPVASVVVTPATTTLAVNNTVQLSAVAQDSAGGALTRPITWSSLAPSVASVSAAGLVTATASGTALVEARATGAGRSGSDVVGSAHITVTPAAVVKAAVHSISVTSPRGFIVPGDTMHLTVVLRDAQSNVLTGRVTTFSSSAASHMTVDSAGVVTGIGSSGRSDIVVTSEGKSAKLQISSMDAVAFMTVTGPSKTPLDLVIPRGGNKKFTVTLDDASRKGVKGQVVSVSSSNVNVVQPSSSSVTTGGSGSKTIDLVAGTTGVAVVTFTVARGGAIPPGTAGRNSVTISLPIVVP